MDQMT